MSYMSEWLGWKEGKIPDEEIIARMHIDPFFKSWFEEKRKAMFDARELRGQGGEERRRDTH